MSFDDSDDDLMMTMADEDKIAPQHRLVLNSNLQAVEATNSFAFTGSRSSSSVKIDEIDDDDDDRAKNNKLRKSDSSNLLQQLLDDSPKRTLTEVKRTSDGRLIVEDSFVPDGSGADWSPHTPEPGQANDVTPPARIQPASASSSSGVNHMQIPLTPSSSVAIPSSVQQQQQFPHQPVDSSHVASSAVKSAQRPTTWSAKKAAKKDAAAAVTPTPAKGTPSSSSSTSAVSPIPLAASASLSGVSSIFLPVQRKDTAAAGTLFSPTRNINNNNNNNNGSSDDDHLDESAKLLLFFVDHLSSTEEYRRLSLESRQNEARCSIVVAFSQISLRIMQQRETKMESLEQMLGKWFRRASRYSDTLLDKKLEEANSFLEHLSAMATQQLQQQHHHQMMASGGGGHLSPRSPSIHSFGGHSNFTMSMNAAQMMMMEHTAARDRHGSNPTESVGGGGGGMMTGGGIQHSNVVRFHSAPLLQKAVLQFSRNFVPLNSPPSAGQVRAEGILADMNNWGQGDFGDMSYLTAPLVLVVGPKSGGKSSVVHCLTNKKPFFSTLPKVQPTVGIMAHVAQLKDVSTSAQARVTLTTAAAEGITSSASLDSGGGGAANLTNRSFVSAPSSAQPWSESSMGARVSRAAPLVDRGGNVNAGDQVVLKSSAALRFLEVPQHMVSSLPPRIVPLSGFELALCFDITLDGTKARRELAAQFRQVVATVTAAVQDRGEVQHPVLVPVYLFATHVDKMRGNDKSHSAVVGLLRDLRLWFKFVQEAAVGSGAASSAGSASPAEPASPVAAREAASTGTPSASSFQSQQQSTTGSFVQFYLVDVYAVSCDDWTVAGERPRSANSFPEVAADLFRTMAALRPLTPVHLGAQILEQFVEALTSYEDAAGTTSIENLDGIRSAMTIKADCNAHIGNEIAVRQVVDGSGSNSLTHMPFNIQKLNLAVPVRRVILGVTTFMTGIGRWANSCGYFVDYALFLRLVLQHVSVGKIIEDIVGLKPGDAQHEHMSKIFGRCMQYAFVDVLSYHGIVTVDEEEGFSSVVVGPQVFTRVVNCFYGLQAAAMSARQLNVTEKAAVLFNENKHCVEFPEIGRTDRDPDGSSDSAAMTPAQEAQLHGDVMRDLSAWQFGAVTPFAWRALLRGHLSPVCASENDFFVWCSRLIGPLGFLEPRWSPGHIDFVLPPTSQMQHQSTVELSKGGGGGGSNTPRSGGTPRATGGAASAAFAVEPGPLLLSTMVAKHIDTRSHQFIVASLTTADDNSAPITSTATFSSTLPVSSILFPQAVLVSLLRSAASNDTFTMQDIALWNNCLCFSTYWRDLSDSNNINVGTAWDYCCMILMHWDFESSSSGAAICRIHVAGASAAGSPKRMHAEEVDKKNTPDKQQQQQHLHRPPQEFRVDVSSSLGALKWIKHDIDHTLSEQNPVVELRPSVSYRDGKGGGASSHAGPMTFSGIAQTAREILAGCSRAAADTLLADLQALHERTWGETPPLREVLQTLMMEERVGPVYPQRH